MNIVSIAFLFLLAGPLLRRYGLQARASPPTRSWSRCSPGHVVVLAAAGAGSVALLARCRPRASPTSPSPTARPGPRSTRCTRSCPNRTGFAAQAAVEGIGVPLAIAVSGVLILLLQRASRRRSPRRSPSLARRVRRVDLGGACGSTAPTAPRSWTRCGVGALLNPDAELEATIEDAAIAPPPAGERRLAARRGLGSTCLDPGRAGHEVRPGRRSPTTHGPTCGSPSRPD